MGRHDLSKFCIRMVDELEQIFDQLKKLKKKKRQMKIILWNYSKPMAVSHLHSGESI